MQIFKSLLKNQSQSQKRKAVNFRSEKVALKDLIEMKKAPSVEIAIKNGVSCWLNARPMKRYLFHPTKGELQDGIAVRYGLDPVKLQLTCEFGEILSARSKLVIYISLMRSILFDNQLNEDCDVAKIVLSLQILQVNSLQLEIPLIVAAVENLQRLLSGHCPCRPG